MRFMSRPVSGAWDPVYERCTFVGKLRKHCWETGFDICEFNSNIPHKVRGRDSAKCVPGGDGRREENPALDSI